MTRTLATPIVLVWVLAMGVPRGGQAELPVAGSYSEVLIISEDGSRDTLSREFASRLSRPVNYYIGQESPFTVTQVTASEAAKAPSAKNVVILGVADPVSRVGEHIVSLLDQSAVEQVRAGKAGIFKKEDTPGRGQLTVIVTAVSEPLLADIVRLRGDEIVDTIEESCRRRLRLYLLRSEDKEITRSLRDKYGFTIQVPRDYRILAESADPPGVQLLREAPARLLGVFWLDWNHSPTPEDSDALFKARAAYVWKSYDGDLMDSTRVEHKFSRLGNYPALELSGYWTNARAVAGGCYQTFFVYDERQKLLWGIDLLVYAPGLAKHAYFRELEALAETFRYD